MTAQEMMHLLDELRSMPAENEWLEFKEARTSYDFDDLGRYFSALSNEANLRDRPCGWFIMGINDKTRAVTGTSFKKNKAALDRLKCDIANHTGNRITFKEIYEIFHPDGRVILFQIPAAPRGLPVSWKGHFYGRDGESLVPLNIHEIEEIRNQSIHYDWSGEICEKATIDDLDEKAIQKAQSEYRIKFLHLSEDIDRWDSITFLNKAKVTIDGKITKTAIILLGKPESDVHLRPSIATITWILRDEHNMERDYEHFSPPFLLNVDRILGKLRNLKYRYLPGNTLFPIEIDQYEEYVIREALHNCIAHQDYGKCSRVIVVEKPEELIFSNAGHFLPQSIEAVIDFDSPQKYYRNRFLAQAMFNLNMIDTIGGGIKKMFMIQRGRNFPLPSYDLSRPDELTVRIYGKILDENYTRMLIHNTDLGLKTVIALDKVQKRAMITREEAGSLRSKKLIEGRYPNIFIASGIASITDEKARYIKYRAFNEEHYKKMVVDYLKKFGTASRKDIDDLLIDKLSDLLSEKQKRNRIRNLLTKMSYTEQIIENDGSRKKPLWKLVSQNK